VVVPSELAGSSVQVSRRVVGPRIEKHRWPVRVGTGTAPAIRLRFRAVGFQRGGYSLGCGHVRPLEPAAAGVGFGCGGPP
jgi:hypothetical protein